MATYQAVAAALGDPMRLAIVERLSVRPHAVGELADGLPVSRPAVSLHLKVLKDAGLVVDSKAGTRRIYQLDPAGLEILRAFLDRLWSRALTSFADAVNNPPDDSSDPDDQKDTT